MAGIPHRKRIVIIDDVLTNLSHEDVTMLDRALDHYRRVLSGNPDTSAGRFAKIERLRAVLRGDVFDDECDSGRGTRIGASIVRPLITLAPQGLLRVQRNMRSRPGVATAPGRQAHENELRRQWHAARYSEKRRAS
jgi:hypothetical protein